MRSNETESTREPEGEYALPFTRLRKVPENLSNFGFLAAAGLRQSAQKSQAEVLLWPRMGACAILCTDRNQQTISV